MGHPDEQSEEGSLRSFADAQDDIIMITIIDYGMGNLRSVQKALEKFGAKTVITHDPQTIEQAGKVVLPGVGAIKPAMDRLTELNLVPAIKKVISADKPFLGICLGFQILFEQSNEGGNVKGLGILKGDVQKFTHEKVPQIGWNQIKIQHKNDTLFRNIDDKSYVYFCHSYFVTSKDKDIVAAKTDYGVEYASAVCRGNLWGVQFHPEKSQTVGLKILENFVKI